MYYQTITGLTSPTANIAVNRNRLKSYGEKIYLKDKTHYEIELFNPKTTKVLAKIYLDGIAISSSGVIVNPGQRVFLERWLDEPKKFLFETYEVEASLEAINATKENGKIRVEFYDQFIPEFNIQTSTWTYTSSPCFGGTTQTNLYSTNIGQNSSTATHDMFIPNNIETGRSEKGESSDQKFKHSSDSFSDWVCASINLQILPESQKPVEVKEIRNYCTSCGTRHKKSSWKFCPNCGTKI
jgi:hypothetical protein